MTSVTIGFSNELGIDKKEIQNFYCLHWARKIALSNNEFYTWQFIDTPINNDLDKCCVALCEGELVAVMGATEREFSLENKTMKGVELTTWIVKEDKRNLAIGQKMISFLQDNFEIIFAMGISKSALPLYLSNDFKYIKAIPRFIKSRNNKVIKKYGNLTPEFKLISRIKNNEENYSEINVTHEIVDEIFCKFKKDYNSFYRDYKWINWRFLLHPFYDYHIKIIENEYKDKCVLVYRIEKKEEFAIMHCIDIFGDNGAYQSALYYLENQAKELNVDVIDIYSTNSKLNANLMSRNWVTTVDNDLVNFPHLFNPIEMRTPTTTSLILWTAGNDKFLLDLGKLHVTKQDCDLDRPVGI